jgi:nicotinamide mononucleotide adenylyltransferase
MASSSSNSSPSPAAGAAYTFPGHKLREVDWSNSTKQPVVILSCGSFSPITYLHLRIFEMARDHLQQNDFDVIGGFASPVSDGYGKKGLAAIGHRLAMVDLALQSSSWVAVDRWEGANTQWTPTVAVMRHFQQEVDLRVGVDPATGRRARVMLLCGSDLLDSFNTPNLWATQDMREQHFLCYLFGVFCALQLWRAVDILQQFGIVCIERDTAATANVIFGNDLLFANSRHIVSVKQFITNDISSTKVRCACVWGEAI